MSQNCADYGGGKVCTTEVVHLKLQADSTDSKSFEQAGAPCTPSEQADKCSRKGRGRRPVVFGETQNQQAGFVLSSSRSQAGDDDLLGLDKQLAVP